MTTTHRPRKGPAPEPGLPTTLEEALTHLRLARALNRSLHAELAQALKQSPLAPPGVSDGEETSLALTRLREQYAVLKLHYEDAQREVEQLKYTLALAHKTMGWYLSDEQLALLGDEGQLDAVLKHLITLVHPDKWSAAQPATELAHTLTQALNEARARLAHPT